MKPEATDVCTPTRAAMQLMRPTPPACPECATLHAAADPHNALSLFYAVKFSTEQGRDPDWRDAMDHCDDDVRERWRAALYARGVDVDAGEIHPTRVRA